MTPGAHLLISWLCTVEVLNKRRERTVVALSGMAPDIDGLGIIVDKLTGLTNYYQAYHHYLGHSIFSAFIIASLASAIATAQRKLVWLLSFFVIHVHVICDVIGSKGPDGYQWPVYYLYPFIPDYELTWQYQWELNAWQNYVIIAGLIGANFYYASKMRITFLEVISSKLNDAAITMYDNYVRKIA